VVVAGDEVMRVEAVDREVKTCDLVVVALSEQELGHFSPQMFPTVQFAGRPGTVSVASPSQLPTISSSRKQSVISPAVAVSSTELPMSWQWSRRQAA